MKTGTWPSRWPALMALLWVALPFTTGELIDTASLDHDTPIRTLEVVGAWAGWLLTLIATLVRRPVTLTVVRLGTSAAVVAAVFAALGADDSSTIVLVTGVLVPVAALLTAMSAPVGAEFVDGASYGDERRFPLRPPVALLAGPIPLTWAVVIAGTAAGPLLLAARQWAVGAVVTVIGLTAAVIAVRALHGLAVRWLVFVPAGVVLHDTMSTREPFLMVRGTVSTFEPATSDTDLVADDLLDGTHGASGIVMLIELHKAVEIITRPARGEAASVHRVNRVAFVPSRPGAVVAEARRRGIG